MLPRIPDTERKPLVAAIVVTALIIAFGGASRLDVVSQVVVQWIGIGALLWWWMTRHRQSRALPIFPVALLAALAALMVLQLVPLPAPAWQALPGRELFARIDGETGLGARWRQLSLDPDATLSALLGLLVPAAALAVMARTERSSWPFLALAILTMITLSCIIGLLQIAGGGDVLYFYRVTNNGSPVGLFSNRNHHAVAIAFAPPLIAAVLGTIVGKLTNQRMAVALLGAIFLLCLATILVNGSRLGLALFAVSSVGALVLLRMAPPEQTLLARSSGRRLRSPRRGVAALGAVILLLVVVVAGSQFDTVERAGETSLSEEKRLRQLGPLLDIARTYFPAGTGFGSFPDVFKIHERDDALALTYLNHAHNDLVEVVIEGGAAAALLALAFAGAFLLRSWQVWRTGRQARAGSREIFARTGSLIVLLLLLGSITDYPLRTPSLGYIGMLALLWMWMPPAAERAGLRPGAKPLDTPPQAG